MSALTRKEAEELRTMRELPPAIRMCLELVYIALNLDKLAPRIQQLPEGARLPVAWDKVQLMLARHQTLLPAMTRFEPEAGLAAPALRRYAPP